MIDVLNQKVMAQSQETPQTAERKQYELLPEGRYAVEVEDIKQWQPKTKDVWVNMRDGQNRLIKDATGKVKKELHKNLTFYTCDVTLVITDGDFKNRKVWTSLTTHPNAQFITEGFLYAVNEKAMTFGQIPNLCIGKRLEIETKNEEYTKTVTNADTGLEENITKQAVRVHKFIRPETTSESVLDNIDI